MSLQELQMRQPAGKIVANEPTPAASATSECSSSANKSYSEPLYCFTRSFGSISLSSKSVNRSIGR
jgi:hypothetical protein